MGLFRRKRDTADKASTAPASTAAVPAADGAAPDAALEGESPQGGGATGASVDDQQIGPFDSTQVPSTQGFVDLGAIRLPGIQGLVMSMEMDQSTGDVTAVRIHLGESQLQLQAFAAPRSTGIWDEIRSEIAEALTPQGGGATEQEGPFGTELLVRMPGRGSDGRAVTNAMRFVGVDHSRWFLRGVISGPAASDVEAAKPFIDLMHVTVVHRGDEPMAPRELLPLRLPQEPEHQEAVLGADEAAARAQSQDEGAADGVSTDDLRPFDRGPEITEIR